MSEELPKSVQDRIERNRQKALVLKQSRLVTHPYSKSDVVSVDKSIIKIGTTRYKDTGGGFLLEEKDDELDEDVVKALLETEAPIFLPDRPECDNCKKTFASSWLFDNFEFKCCDECKNPDTHKLITKTEAVNTYLLKDCDLDKREPPLKFIKRKNPHNVRWGDMKLYLELQVEQRALEVWGSEEKIQEEKELREEKKAVAKNKKYNKQLKELRMSMRSSLYDRTSSSSHTHIFDSETYNEEDDTYHRKCTTCPYEETFEKM